PLHPVTITRPFYLGVGPVTQGQYEKVTGANPSQHRDEPDHALLPVENVSWDEADAFCRLLSNLPAERAAGRGYRLPAEAQGGEAEGEYAGRAGTSPPFAFGASLPGPQANFDGNSPGGDAPRGPYLARPTPVGSSPANAWGLFDMHGNVWEWCADWFDPDYYR